MRRAAYCILTAFLAAGVYGAIPQKAGDWYTPPGNKFKIEYTVGKVWYLDENGEEAFIAISVDADGKIIEDESFFDDLGISIAAYEAMKEALWAQTIAFQNKQRIETLGTNLENVFKEMKTESTDNSGGTATGTAKITPGDGKAQVVIAGISPSADGHSLEKTNNTFRIKGWPNIENGSFLAKNNDAVCGEWLHPTNGLDMVTNYFSVFGLANWEKPGNTCKVYLNDLVKDDKHKDERNKHRLLSRYDDGTLHYMSLGDALDFGPQPDGFALTTNALGKATIAGFDDAVGDKYPFKTGDRIEWRPLPPEIDSASLSTNKSGKLQIAGFDSDAAYGDKYLCKKGSAVEWNDIPPEIDGASLATNKNGKIEIAGYYDALSDRVLAKTARGLEWTDMPGGAGGSPDNMTLTNILGKLSLVGWETQPSNSVLYARWDEDEHTNYLQWVEWVPGNRCNCPKYCYIHEVEYNSLGFCPREGCPHSQFGFGVSEGNGSENISDSIIDGI